jgi:hypothetical protein
MRKTIGCVWLTLSLIAALPLSAETKVPTGWKGVPDDHRSPFPTEHYVPTDSRNASVLISVMGKGDGRITNAAALSALYDQVTQTYQSGQKTPPMRHTLTLPDAIGYYSTFEDPDLVGKPPIRDNYKFTTPILLRFSNGVLVSATIFADEAAGPTFEQQLSLVRNFSLSKASASVSIAPADLALVKVTMPELDALLAFPAKDWVAMPALGNSGPSYFSYVNNANGMVISGWLDSAARYRGFVGFWKDEKRSFETNSGMKIQDEQIRIFDGWQLVTYAIPLSGGAQQWNLRACRTVQKTWADVHLSTTSGSAESLIDFLKKIMLVPKPAN